MLPSRSLQLLVRGKNHIQTPTVLLVGPDTERPLQAFGGISTFPPSPASVCIPFVAILPPDSGTASTSMCSKSRRRLGRLPALPARVAAGP